MKTKTKLFLTLLCGVAIAPAAFGQTSASGTISGVQNGANWNYTITLTDTGATQIGSLWYAWTPDVSPNFYLPAGTISNISGQNGWTGSTVANSIQFVGGANALNAGNSVELFYTASFSPTTLAATLNSGLSVAYSGGIEASASTGDFTIAIVAAPEPSPVALIVIGLVGLAFFGGRRLASVSSN